MTKITGKKYVLAEQATKDMDLTKVFRLESEEFDTTTVGDKTLVKLKYWSNDPAQRTWISAFIPEDRHYTKPVEVGQTMPAGAVGVIVETGSDKYRKGDLVYGYFGWCEYKLVSDAQIAQTIDIEPTDYFALGGTALTAYFGLLRIGKATSKDKTIVVSGAAGATGSAVCMIAKNVLGCKTVVGIAGSDEKCKVLKTNCGVDIALNYKDKDFKKKFEEATPEYIDVYFDNVGGEILDMALDRIALKGRIVACGAISGYDKGADLKALSMGSWFKIVSMKARIEGFIVTEYAAEHKDALKELQEWVAQGKIKPLKTIYETEFEGLPEGMAKLLRGENTGKLVTVLKE